MVSVLDAALRHIFERRSVAREGEVLSAALELHPDFFRWRELRDAFEGRTDIIRSQGELTLRKIWQEERATADRARLGRNQRFPLGSPSHLTPSLKPGQLAAAQTLLENRDFMAVLVGDAGTGKTTLLQAIQAAHLSVGGQPFVSLAPTTKARDALIENGFVGSETVQHFLASERLQGEAHVGRPQVLPLSEGEQVLIRGREDSQGFTNGEIKTVGRIEGDRVTFTDGTTLPPNFAAWTYGHAVTAYRSQGSSSEESLLILGPVAEKALLRRQFYVGNTRYKGSNAIYVSNREAILRRVAQRDPGRELATEFTRRHQISEAVNQRAERRRKHVLRVVWEQFRARLRRRRAQTVEHHRGESPFSHRRRNHK